MGSVFGCTFAFELVVGKVFFGVKGNFGVGIASISFIARSKAWFSLAWAVSSSVWRDARCRLNSWPRRSKVNSGYCSLLGPSDHGIYGAIGWCVLGVFNDRIRARPFVRNTPVLCHHSETCGLCLDQVITLGQYWGCLRQRRLFLNSARNWPFVDTK